MSARKRRRPDELPPIIPGAWCTQRGCVAPARWTVRGEDWCENHRPLSTEEIERRRAARKDA